MSEEEIKLINETMQLDYSQLVLGCVHLYMEKKKLKSQLQQKENIIKEVRELVENGTDFKSIYFKKDKEDLWKVILAYEVKEAYLEILDKGKE